MSDNAKVVSKPIMWLIWVVMGLLSLLMAHFLVPGAQRLNSLQPRNMIFAIGMLVIPIVICGGFRLWLSHCKNPWLALIPYFLGVFFAQQAGLYGIFLVPEFWLIFQILSAWLLLLYLPLFVKLRQSDGRISKN
jgi:hypothetical protein